MEIPREFPQLNSLAGSLNKSRDQLRPKIPGYSQFIPKIVRTALAVAVGSIGASSAPIEAFGFAQNRPFAGQQTVESGLPSLQATIFDPSGQRMRVLYEEGPQNPEREIFNNIEVIAMSSDAAGDRLATIFRDPVNGTVHAARMRPDLVNKRWIGEEIKVHPDIEILHGIRLISGGVKVSEDGKIVVVFGYKRNREDRGGIEDYSNDGAFSFDGETLYTHPEMGEIVWFEISTDNKYDIIGSRNKSKPTEINIFLFDPNTKEITQINGGSARIETRVRPESDGTYTSYFANMADSIGEGYVGYTKTTFSIRDRRVVNSLQHPEQGTIGRLDEFMTPAGRMVLAINNSARNPQGVSVDRIFVNSESNPTPTVWHPNLDRVVSAVGGIPEGYENPSVRMTASADLKGSNKVVAAVYVLVSRKTDGQNKALPVPGGFVPDNPSIEGFFPPNGLPTISHTRELGWREIMRNLFTLRQDNAIFPITTMAKTPYFYNPDAREWQTGPVSLRR